DCIQAARGWLQAQYGHDASIAAEWGVTCTATPPSRLTDEDVAHEIEYADHIAECEFWEDRRRGY
ncbi:MAG: hypothetical protein ACSLEZ_14675, partial [Thiobacillus sp.]